MGKVIIAADRDIPSMLSMPKRDIVGGSVHHLIFGYPIMLVRFSQFGKSKPIELVRVIINGLRRENNLNNLPESVIVKRSPHYDEEHTLVSQQPGLQES
jgi:hypothetical protein